MYKNSIHCFHSVGASSLANNNSIASIFLKVRIEVRKKKESNLWHVDLWIIEYRRTRTSTRTTTVLLSRALMLLLLLLLLLMMMVMMMNNVNRIHIASLVAMPVAASISIVTILIAVVVIATRSLYEALVGRVVIVIRVVRIVVHVALLRIALIVLRMRLDLHGRGRGDHIVRRVLIAIDVVLHFHARVQTNRVVNIINVLMLLLSTAAVIANAKRAELIDQSVGCRVQILIRGGIRRRLGQRCGGHNRRIATAVVRDNCVLLEDGLGRKIGKQLIIRIVLDDLPC